MKLLLIIFIMLFLPCFGHDTIQWSANDQVVWKDFKGKPDESSKHAAITSYIISTPYKELKNGDIRLIVTTYFNKKKSWAKKKYETLYLLNHEHLHFDIAEIYAREIRKAVMDSITTTKSFSRKFHQVYSTYFKQCDARQIQYDKETNHSIIKSEQERWDKMVKRELDSLSAYQQTTIIIHKK